MVSKSSAIAACELVVAALFWGFGFIAAVWGLRAMDAFELTAVRFFLATLAGILILAPRVRRVDFQEMMKVSFWPGVLTVGTLVLQTWGLQYTTATKCGFITTLYVVFVPVLESWHRRHRIPLSLWICVTSALFGTLLIVNVGLLSELNVGDLLTFIAALFATGQIYLLGLIGPKLKRPFVFNTAQSAWAFFICVPFFFHDQFWLKLMNIGTWPSEAYLGVASLAFGSTAFAFYLQARAQRKLSPTVASLLCLLESPLAMIFAFYLLNESLGPTETLGAILIFGSAVAASFLEATMRKKKH